MNSSVACDIQLVASYRVRVFVLEEYLEKVLASVKTATNLKYGNYDGVSWCSHSGTERCTPRAGCDTYAGNIDEPYMTDSTLVEFSIVRDKKILDQVILSIFASHPWDEPVISIQETLETRKNGVI
ncbi:hypothetical protein HA399_10450 [Cobetia sp. UIB-001]|uniref:hypothetical protein n=1 Tax=Cobetia sp. UIB-001 TaxID=2717697 RepID=UPI00384F57D0